MDVLPPVPLIVTDPVAPVVRMIAAPLVCTPLLLPVPLPPLPWTNTFPVVLWTVTPLMSIPSKVPAVVPVGLAIRLRLPEPPAVTPAPIVIPPVVVSPMLPFAAAVVEMAPVTDRFPVWLIVTSDPAAVPLWVMPVTVKVVDVLVRLIAPLVRVGGVEGADGVGTGAIRVVPVAEDVVRVPVVLTRPLPDSVIVLPAVRSIAPEVLLTVPAMLMPPELAPRAHEGHGI